MVIIILIAKIRNNADTANILYDIFEKSVYLAEASF